MKALAPPPFSAPSRPGRGRARAGARGGIHLAGGRAVLGGRLPCLRRLLVAGPQRRPDRGVRLVLGETGCRASAGQLVRDAMTVLLNRLVRSPVQPVVPVPFA